MYTHNVANLFGKIFVYAFIVKLKFFECVKQVKAKLKKKTAC